MMDSRVGLFDSKMTFNNKQKSHLDWKCRAELSDQPKNVKLNKGREEERGKQTEERQHINHGLRARF